MKEYIFQYHTLKVEDGQEYQYRGDYVDELIRCKNCRRWNSETKKCFYGGWKKKPDDYCSWAVEKKG